MKKNHFLFLLLLIAFCFSACKKNITPEDEPGGPDPVVKLDLKEVTIIVPANSSFKPAGSKIFSYGTEQTIDGGGKAKVTFEKGSSTIAYVFDEAKKLVLAGFITDSTSVISPATTAKVLLYLGYNIPLQPDTLSVYFLNNVHALPGYVEWEKEFEALFLADPLILSKGTFVTPLRERMAQMIDNSAPIDILGKAADIHVDANDIKSGIQVSDNNLSSFSITNSYRRRAHAFLYKMAYKDMNGAPHEVKKSIEKGTKADKDMIVDPVAPVNGFFSEIGKNIEGKGLESFSVSSGPFPLELEDKESEALYKLRVIGPGATEGLALTEAESSKLTRLEMETFLLDLVIPAVSLMLSLPDNPQAGVMPSIDRDLKSDAMLSLVKTMPDVYDEIKKGNYKAALKKFMENVAKDASGALLKELIMIALDRETDKIGGFINERIENLLFILQMTDAAFGVSDVIRISANALSSRKSEEWEIKARESQVTLSPKNSTVVPFKQQKLTAFVKNLTGSTGVSYEWKTSGKWGKLSDTRGHTNQVTFSSPDKDVFYYSNAAQASLSDGDNLEYIYVTAYMGTTKLGTDTAIINVKKDKYEMKPNGVTVSGKDKANNKVKLYLLKTDGTNTIQSNPDFDYKVIWSTAGKHGRLNGKDVSSVRTLTVYNDNAVVYECLDKDTKEGAETITVKVYSKAKSAPESDYKLFDEISGSVKINNDEKKKIYHIGASLYHFDEKNSCVTSQPGCNVCYKATVAYVTEEKDAKSYSIKFYGQKDQGGYTNQSWTPTNHSFSGPSFGTPKYSGGKFTVVYDWGSAGSLAGNITHVNWNGSGGMAEVTVILK